VNDEKLKVLTNLANTFNNFFVTVTEHLNIEQVGKGYAISVLTDSFPGNFPQRKNDPNH
jgi:hypothetical protein